MGTDAIIMMSAILILVWGGFILSLAIAFRSERRRRKENDIGTDTRT